MSLYAVK